MTKKIFFILLCFLISFNLFSQEDLKTYKGSEFYEVTTFPQVFKNKKPKNIILLIGDGMGVNQLFAGLTANGGRLFIENMKYTGFVKTSSANRFITDSAAGGTALSTGVKTYNGAIGLDENKNPVPTILQEAVKRGLSAGLVSTSAVTHATPAAFIAHQPDRNMYEEIAADFLNTDIDVFIGGGYKHFADRKDGRNLLNELQQKGYTVETELESIARFQKGKLAGLTAKEHNGRVSERGNMLQVATRTAINVLQNNKKGFFLMVEGSQIDWAGHEGNAQFIVEETLDFDRAVGVALDFASKNRETLVIVTADHETGGMVVLNGNYETGMVKAEFTTGGHTAAIVPVFAFGPGASAFQGFMENTDVHLKMKKLLMVNKAH